MKKLNILFLLGILITSISFTSCEKLADDVQNAVEVTINTDFEAPFVATPTNAKANADGSSTFDETVILDPSNSGDLSDYLDKIESVEIKSIHVLVTSISDPYIVLRSATFTVTDNVDHGVFTYSTPENSAIAVGSTFEIPADNPGWDVINKAMNDMHATTVHAVGAINQDTFEIGFVYIISVKVLAKG